MKFLMTTRYGPSDRVRTCGLMVPNHPRYQLRHTRLYYFILYCYTYWLSAFNPRASLRNIVAALRLERSLRSLFLHLGAMPFSATGGGIPPRPTVPHPVLLCFLVCFLLIDFLLSMRGASLRNIVAALRPTEGQTPQKPFKFTRDILPFLARFVNLDEDVIGGKYPRLYFP